MRHPLLTTVAAVAAISLLAAGGFWACDSSSGGQSARSIAQALADRLSDDLDFENGEEQDGPPPEEHAGDTAYPQVQGFAAPMTVGGAEVDYDVPFTVTLYAAGDDLTRVTGAIAHIVQANKDDVAESHILITPPAPVVQGGAVNLSAQVHRSADLAGNAFYVRMALVRDDGTVGNYASWNLITLPRAGDTTVVDQCSCIGYGDPENPYQLGFTNLSIVGECTAADVLEQFYGVEGGAEPFPCDLWLSAIHGYNSMASGEPMVPSGSRFETYWSTPPCVLEIDCSKTYQDAEDPADTDGELDGGDPTP